MEKDLILSWFPKLKRDKNFKVTSPATRRYNCVAWASGYDNKWEWPSIIPELKSKDDYWPEGVEDSTSIASFIDNFKSKGFEVTDNLSYDPTKYKVALFSLNGDCTHACRLMADGVWTSKLGYYQDIQHSLKSLEGKYYGKIYCVMSKDI